MRKYLITAILSSMFYGVFGQSTFPNNGNVGIGTQSPNSLLSIQVGLKKKTEVDNISPLHLLTSHTEGQL